MEVKKGEGLAASKYMYTQGLRLSGNLCNPNSFCSVSFRLAEKKNSSYLQLSMSEDVPLAVLKARSASPTKVLSKQRKSRKRSFWQSDSEIGIDGSRQVEASKRKKSDKRKLSKRKSEQVSS